MGWFYGFKLHLIIDDRGEILNFMITPGNTDDREPLRNERYVQDIRGKLCGDRGYIGKALFEMLFINGIQLVTRVRNNMKNIAQIEHSMQRTFNESFADTPDGETCTPGTTSHAIRSIITLLEPTYREILSNVQEKQKELLYSIAIDGKAEASPPPAQSRPHPRNCLKEAS